MAIMTDGYKTTISLTGAGTTFEEKTVQPPGLSGGDMIDTTSMRNNEWRTKYPRQLVTATECPITVSYDPSLYNSIIDSLNDNQSIVITFPDNSTLTFWGALRQFQPNANTEGEQPQATITIEPTNMDGSYNEVAPAYSGSGA